MTLDDRNHQVNEALEVRFSQLNSALELQEARLKGMMVPKEACIGCLEYGHNKLDPVGPYRFLIGMTKLRGAWRLVMPFMSQI